MADLHGHLLYKAYKLMAVITKLDKLTAKNQYEANNKNIRDIIRVLFLD